MNKYAGLAVLLISANAPAEAQFLYGSLTGNVTDAQGAALPGASIEAVNVNTSISKRTASDDRGAFVISDLQPGTYDVVVTSPSFASLTQKGVTLMNNTVLRLDAKLQVAQVTENVIVEAAAVSLQTDRADINQHLSTRQLSDLPVTGQRNYQALLKLVPGISPPRSNNSEAGNPHGSLVTNVNGASYSTNNSRLDGASNIYPWLPHHAAYIPPAEAVEAVNVVTNSFDAEQGLAGGSVVNVMVKSGTNQFHGSAFEFHTNSALRARNYFYLGSALPKNILNQYGGTFGGPIEKNKLFFFGDFEGTRRRQNVSRLATIATEAQRRGDFSGAGAAIFDPDTGAADGSGRQLFPNNLIPTARIDPASAKLLSLVPAANQPGFTNNYFASGSLLFNRENYDVKINYNPSDKCTLFGRYSLYNSLIFDPPSLG